MQQPKLGQATENIELLRQALARNPGDLDVGLMLGSALHGVGDYIGSASALKNVLTQHPDHCYTLLLLARSLARAGNIAEALEVLAKAQKIDPSDPQAWQVAAALAAQVRDWSELLRIAHTWTTFHPHAIDAWQALSRAHFEQSRFSEAISAFDPVLKLESKNPLHLVSAARLEIAAAHYEAARRLLDEANELAPESGELLYTLSRLHHMTGELSLAEDFCRRAIGVLPRFAPAYVSLGTLCEGRLEETEINAALQLFNDATVHPEYRVMLGFTLGDAFDHKGEYERAFNFWESANRLNSLISEREGIVYEAERVERECELIKALFAEPIELPVHPQALGEPEPIFIVGMPRSGTTLIESILASHSIVYGAGELPTLYDIHEELMVVLRNSGVIAAREMICTHAHAWRNRYFAALPQLAGATKVVDKQPLNFRSVGLIRLLFPNSPIIYTRREPMDVGLSIFRHKFSKNWPCAHSLRDIGHYYRVHEKLCESWREKYPQAMHVVDHAELVKNLDFEIRQLLKIANLDFETACLTPHKTKRPIATFSSVQVKKPVSNRYSNRFVNYSSHLEPLRDALRTSGR